MDLGALHAPGLVFRMMGHKVHPVIQTSENNNVNNEQPRCNLELRNPS